MLFGFTQCFTGDTLVATEDGKERTAGRVEVERLSKPVKVYNLEIEDSHVYYVSGAGVLVHNACGDSAKPEQVHHFFTNKNSKYTVQFETILNKYELDLDGDWNKALMPHQGRHSNAYHDYMLLNLRKFDRIAKGGQQKFLDLFNNVKQIIIDNPEMLYKDYWIDK